jgi:SAM-dependent methyltransferase
VDRGHMRDFWDERAREDPYFFVDDRRAYRDGELTSFWTGGERDLDRLLAALEVAIEPGDVVVEIGCGVGRLTRPIAQRARHVYAIDVSERMLARAREHHQDLDNVDWILGDGVSLQPLADASADACVSHVVFQHIPDPAITLGYIGEMGRVLRAGGWGAFQFSNDASVHRRRAGIRDRLRAVAAAVGRAPRGRDDPAWLGSALDLERVKDVVAANVLELERVVGAGTQFCAARVRRAGGGQAARLDR